MDNSGQIIRTNLLQYQSQEDQPTSMPESEVQVPERETKTLSTASLPYVSVVPRDSPIQNFSLLPYPWPINSDSWIRHFFPFWKKINPSHHPTIVDTVSVHKGKLVGWGSWCSDSSLLRPESLSRHSTDHRAEAYGQSFMFRVSHMLSPPLCQSV